MVEEVEGAGDAAEVDRLAVVEVMMLDGVDDKMKLLYSLVRLE